MWLFWSHLSPYPFILDAVRSLTAQGENRCRHSKRLNFVPLHKWQSIQLYLRLSGMAWWPCQVSSFVFKILFWRGDFISSSYDLLLFWFWYCCFLTPNHRAFSNAWKCLLQKISHSDLFQIFPNNFLTQFVTFSLTGFAWHPPHLSQVRQMILYCFTNQFLF